MLCDKRVGPIVSEAVAELHAGHDAASRRHVAAEFLLNCLGAMASIKDRSCAPDWWLLLDSNDRGALGITARVSVRGREDTWTRLKSDVNDAVLNL